MHLFAYKNDSGLQHVCYDAMKHPVKHILSSNFCSISHFHCSASEFDGHHSVSIMCNSLRFVVFLSINCNYWKTKWISWRSWFISSPRSSHLTSVIITTLIIHHPIILPFQTQNFPISQILPSVDIWHLIGLISRIRGLLHGFFLCFSFFLVFRYHYFLPF